MEDKMNNEDEIKITLSTDDEIVDIIKHTAKELGYVYTNKQLRNLYRQIVDDILGRYLNTEYIDNETISDLIIDSFTKENTSLYKI